MSALPEIAQAMLKPETYPEPPQKIELMQTQMSFIFLAGDYVYKVKKPVNLGYLDYTTLEKRKFFCQKEVELNRRLCPETYLGVLPITKTRRTNFAGRKGQHYRIRRENALSTTAKNDECVAGKRTGYRPKWWKK